MAMDTEKVGGSGTDPEQPYGLNTVSGDGSSADPTGSGDGQGSRLLNALRGRE